MLTLINKTLHYVSDDGLQVSKILDDKSLKKAKRLIKNPPVNTGEVLQLLGLNTFSDNEYFIFKGSSMYLRDVPNISIPKELAQVMYPRPKKKYIKFWKLAALNPNPESRESLFKFIETYGFEVTKEGYLVTYRNVASTDDPEVFTDQHTRTFSIRVGEEVSIDRSQCDSDPNVSCSRGLHLASREWLTQSYYGDTGLVCIVNPMDVVACPYADNYGKMRVCRYFPIGLSVYSGGKVAKSFSYKKYKYNIQRSYDHRIDEVITAREAANKTINKHINIDSL